MHRQSLERLRWALELFRCCPDVHVGRFIPNMWRYTRAWAVVDHPTLTLPVTSAQDSTKPLLLMSTMVATSSRASSSPPSNPMGEQESSRATWTTATFAFPPCISHPARAPIVSSRGRSKSREGRASSSSSSNTSRVINGLPGFDDFAELVMSSERVVPKLTLSTASDHSSARVSRSRRAHPHRSKPSEPKPTAPIIPAQTASLPWPKEDNDVGRVTFIFGRFRPSIVRRSAPSSTTQTTSDNPIRSKDFVNIPSPQEQPTPPS
ncbi:hypothetical protein B0J17DRAFT_628593 [Rhizoctonia solani]|nr:hypothetical protein B0J17DRAFT_628593 [Rhizoctonia solani]